jgi:hypothetical protein
MSLRKFFIGRAIGTIILFSIIGVIAGFYALNNYIYKEKQGNSKISQLENKSKISTFTWKYEKADSLNLDGIPNTNIFLEVKYENGIIQNKLIDTTAGSCNDLPEKDPDSVENSTNIQCYSAGLGYRFKITKGVESYFVERKTFEEALPDYTPPLYQYEVIAEFPFSI